jgi:transcriptional regulator with XRE-family HTH domain
MMSFQQMRAARALLGWKQSDLARLSGFSLAALNNIERGVANPRFSTMEVIQQTFEKSGIEFTPDDGLRMRGERFDVQTFEGDERSCVISHFEDILKTLKNDDRPALYGGIDESYYVKHFRRECFDYYQEAIKYGLKERILICEGDKQRYAPKAVSEYRALPKDLFGMISYAVYGNKYTIMLWGKKSRWIAIEHPGVAEVHRQMFETHWKLGRFVPYTRPLFEIDLEKASL